MLTADEIVKKGNEGLVSCTCEDYLHYCFCKHSFLIGKERGIFLGTPKRLECMHVSTNPNAGCPKTVMKKRGALDVNG